MQLTDLRFLQKTQVLLVQFDDGMQGMIRLAALNPAAQEITALSPISPLQIILYFDGLQLGQVFDVAHLRELIQCD